MNDGRIRALAAAAWLAVAGSVAWAEWIPGTFPEEWPHVVRAQEEGNYLPDKGYRFANDEPGDFSVVPAVAPHDIVLEKGPMPPLRVPPPREFLPVAAIPGVVAMYAVMDAANSVNDVPARWVLRSVRESRQFWEAWVSVAKDYSAARCPYPEFAAARDALSEGLDEEHLDLATRASEKGNRALNDTTRQYGSVGVKGVQSLPAHRFEERAVQFSTIRTDRIEKDGQPIESYYVSSCALVWVGGRLVNLTVGVPTAEESAIEAILEESRSRLGEWVDAVYEANGVTGSVPAEERFLLRAPAEDASGASRSPLDFNEDAGPGKTVGYFVAGGLVVVLLVLFLVLRRFSVSRDCPGASSSPEDPSEDNPAGAPNPVADSGETSDSTTVWSNFGDAPGGVRLVLVACGLSAASGVWQLFHSLDGIGWVLWSLLVCFCVWVASSILAGRKWPSIYLMAGGALALLAGILERATVPSGRWTETSLSLVVGGVVQLALCALLSTPSSMDWRENIRRKQERSRSRTKPDAGKEASHD